MVSHQARKRRLARVPKGRVAKVVGKADRFHKVFVGSQCAGEGTSDLSDFEGVGEAGSIIIAFLVNKDLCFIL